MKSNEVSSKFLSKLFPLIYDYWFKKGYSMGKMACGRSHQVKPTHVIAGSDSEKDKEIVGLRKSVSNLQRQLNGVLQTKQQKKQASKRFYRQKSNTNLKKRLLNESDRCIYCGGEGMTVDHLIPVSRGGKSISSNLGLACRNCNNEKGNMTYDEYMTWRKFHNPYRL